MNKWKILRTTKEQIDISTVVPLSLRNPLANSRWVWYNIFKHVNFEFERIHL